MTWFKVDDSFYDHPKSVRAGDAIALWLRAGCWSAKQLTNGFVPREILPSLMGSAAKAARLVDAGLWVVVEGGWQFHDWSEYQPSRTDVEMKREGARERMRRVREQRGSREQDANVRANTPRTFARSSPNPDPTRPEPEHPDGCSTALARLDAAARPDVEALCQRLADRIEANGSRRPPITKAWRDACRLMLDRDHRSPEQVAAAIDWSQGHDFWRSNVLSMPKLREKYDQMRLQATRATSPNGGPGQRLSPGDRALALIHDLRQENAQ